MQRNDSSPRILADSERPGKVIAVHLNYPSRAAQRGRTPAVPSYFLKPSSSIAATGAALERPLGSELLAFEGEIALIIGKTIRRVQPEEAWSAVSEVTAANDFGIYDLRAADKGSNLRSKGGDGFTPLGPNTISAEGLDPTKLRVRTWVNGILVQEDSSAELLFPFAQLIADLSQLLTLEPGDVILTGTPAGSTVVEPGDVVDVEVDAPQHPGQPSSGHLVTPISAGDTPFADFGAIPIADDQQRAEAFGQTAEQTQDSDVTFLTPERIARIKSVSTATLSSQLRRRGLNSVSIDNLTSTHPGAAMVGRARTLRYIANREDLFGQAGGGYNAQKKAFDTLNPGDVLVIEARGDRTAGTLGDILGLRAQVRGAVGLVTDGGVRDLAQVTDLDIPTFYGGVHPAVLGRRHIPWEGDVTITCGGASIQPGDIIVGDSGGLLVIPEHLVDEVVTDAITQEEEEVFIAEQVAAGHGVDGLYPMNANWRDRFILWKEAHR